MNKLQKEFEKTGYNSWINSDIYPDGKIYTKEYTEWLEKRLVKLLDLPHVMRCVLSEGDSEGHNEGVSDGVNDGVIDGVNT